MATPAATDDRVAMMALLAAMVAATSLRAAASIPWRGTVDFTKPSKPFMGLGGLSGGGGTSRLLYDYAEPQRGQVLDALFSPRKGGSLQILKVEIGGDGQSTEATEASHMHTRDDLNFERGYEWWLMKEAKRRNPDIKLYGLSWAVPGWIGNGSFYEGEDNINYHIKWIEGAKTEHNLTIDYLGIWNERSYDAGWIIRLRNALDSTGHGHVAIVAADTNFGVCNDFAKNKTLADAIGIVGAHYPITNTKPKPIPDSCHQLNKPLWTSEGWNLGEVNDFDGALNLAQTINYNWISQGQTAMVVWTVIYAWYSILPFAHPDARDPIGGMGHGLMSADEPWSGHYRIMSPLYVLAHTTQYVSPGCMYMETDQVMSGGLLNSTASMVAFTCEEQHTVTIVIETAESDGQPVHLSTQLAMPSWAGAKKTMHLRETCDKSWFVAKDELLTVTYSDELLPDQVIDMDAPSAVTVSATLQPKCIYTISTATGQSAVPPASPAIPPPKRFPFPYKDNFDSNDYKDQGTIKYFTDQGGSFNAAPAPSSDSQSEATSGTMALHQVVDTRPIEWGHNPDPVTIAGDITWSNYTVSVACRIGSVSPLPDEPPVLPPLPAPAPPTPEIFSVTSAKCNTTTNQQKFAMRTPNVAAIVSSQTSGGRQQIVYDGGQGCLAATGWNKQFKTPVAGIAACNSSDPNQLWTNTGRKICLYDGCLNLDGGNTKPGTEILIWQGNDPDPNNEDWFLSSNGTVEFGTAIHPLGACLSAGPKHPPGPPPPAPPPPPGPQPSPTSVKICGRIGSYSRGGSPPNGYCLIVDYNNKWYISNGGHSAQEREIENVIASGRVPAAAGNIRTGWVTLKMRFEGDSITPSIGGTTLRTVTDTKWSAGMVGLGSGWNKAWFDDVLVAA